MTTIEVHSEMNNCTVLYRKVRDFYTAILLNHILYRPGVMTPYKLEIPLYEYMSNIELVRGRFRRAQTFDY